MAESRITNSPLMAGATIEATDLGRRFFTPSGVIEAVRHVTLTIPAGEFCVLVGPSGCGKSTFLRMVAGLETPTSGRLDITSPSGATPTNAVVFQGRSLFPWLTVEDNIGYGLRLANVAEVERKDRVGSLLATLGMSRFAKTYPPQISEGMRQRVAIGRALAVDPDLLLMDEPFGALDEQTRYLLQEELLRIWDRTGKTVLFITHSIDEAITLGDRIVVMTAQPGSIRAILDVPFPRPRLTTDVRSNADFGSLFSQTWELLREEVARARLVQEREIAS
ncbi:MAG TPA: ABC transporter ATP-binding protein [Thermomicrobiales bacterium]|nr:ABC transporter ATP-binding protein [Thermomicrobiales bacterium]